MEAARHFSGDPGPATGDIAHTPTTLDTVTPKPSPNGRGFFVVDGSGGDRDPGSQSLPYSLEVADWSELKPKYIKNVAQIATSIVSLEDGSVFVFRDIAPFNQRYDTSTDFALPLATRVNGFNTYLGLKLAARGIRARVVGTNQSHGFTLLHDAQATSHILNEDDQRQAESGDRVTLPGQSARIGYSMGEMKELLELGLAPAMGREILFSIGLDPCLAEEINYQAEVEDPQKTAALALYLGREALEIPRIFGKDLIEDHNPLKTIRWWRHLLETVGITPDYIRNTKDKWDTLATGETGRYLGDIPKDAVGVIHVFDRSHFNSNPLYEQALAGHPNFRLLHENGLHLSGGDRRVIGRVVGQVELGLDLVAQGVPPGELADALAQPVLVS